MLTFQFPYGCGDLPASIAVYSPTSVGGTEVRSLTIGPKGSIASVQDMAVSPTGEIFVNDGKGVAVFSATASGADAPVRYIQWDGGGGAPVTPGYITVDNTDNLYVQNGTEIAVFGPTDNGLVVPHAVINGPDTQLAGGIGRMTTDANRNLYVTTGTANFSPITVLEFAALASGDAVPIRTVTSTGTYPNGMFNFAGYLGVAVDSAGQIYVRATYPYCGAVFIFAANASGNATPLNVLGGTCPASDPDGTIAIY